MGPAPLTSARNAPSILSRSANGDEARSLCGQCSEVARTSDRGERGTQPRGALREARCAVARIECRVDVGGRALARVLRQEEQDGEVLRQLERLELGAVAGPELRAVGEEERHVRPDAGRECV